MTRVQPNTRLPKSPAIKTYTALISQTGTANPTTIILQNTLGGTITWTRDNIGEYIGTLPSPETAEKTSIAIQQCVPGLFNYAINNEVGESDEIYIQTVDSTGAYYDDGLQNTLIEIKIYA